MKEVYIRLCFRVFENGRAERGFLEKFESRSQDFDESLLLLARRQETSTISSSRDTRSSGFNECKRTVLRKQKRFDMRVVRKKYYVMQTDGRWYLMETTLYARLQVDHPLTTIIIGRMLSVHMNNDNNVNVASWLEFLCILCMNTRRGRGASIMLISYCW